jgi:hypothetical protein
MLAVIHRRLGFADHLNRTERVLRVVTPKVEIIKTQRLLKNSWIFLARQSQDGAGIVEHIVPAHLVGAVCQTVRMFIVR